MHAAASYAVGVKFKIGSVALVAIRSVCWNIRCVGGGLAPTSLRIVWKCSFSPRDYGCSSRAMGSLAGFARE